MKLDLTKLKKVNLKKSADPVPEFNHVVSNHFYVGPGMVPKETPANGYVKHGLHHWGSYTPLIYKSALLAGNCAGVIKAWEEGPNAALTGADKPTLDYTAEWTPQGLPKYNYNTYGNISHDAADLIFAEKMKTIMMATGMLESTLTHVAKLKGAYFEKWFGNWCELFFEPSKVPPFLVELGQSLAMYKQISIDTFKGFAVFLSSSADKSNGTAFLALVVHWLSKQGVMTTWDLYNLIKASTWLDAASSLQVGVDIGGVDFTPVLTPPPFITSDGIHPSALANPSPKWPNSSLLGKQYICMNKVPTVSYGGLIVGNFDITLEKIVATYTPPTEIVPAGTLHHSPNQEMLDQMLSAPWGGFGKSVGATLIPTAPYDPLSYMETPSPTGDEMTPLSIDKLKAQLAEKAKTATIEPTAEPVTVTLKTAFESVKDVSEAGGALPAVPPKLALAKFMYQETKGTQNPYYAVAIGPGLKVGARWSPHALAIRFEGPDLQGDAAKWLSMAGIEMKTGYASCHIGFEGENNLSLMQRTLLSMIGATMYKFNSPIPSIERLKKCSQPKSFGL